VLDRALADHPGTAELLRLRARIHLADQEFQPAVTLLQQALALDKHDHASRFQLAQALEFLGRRAEAAEQRRLGQQTQDDLAEVARLNRQILDNPWDAAAQRRLAAACEKLDRHDLALMWRRAAAASAPEPADAPRP
jgi:tetratricopeptide (TPR) repeat protein